MREALVIGGGPAGAALALRLAKGGTDVLLVEKEAEAHHKVCGEFLSAGAVARLHALGLIPEALGAHAIDRVRLVRGGRISEARLPFRALSLSRRVLDETLLEKAAFAGVQLRRGVRVGTVEPVDGHWRAATAGGEIRARSIFLASGKHDLRGQRRPSGLHGGLIGFKMHWRLSAAATEALRGAVELHLFKGGYAGLERIEDGLANLCLVVDRRRFDDWPSLMARLTRTPVLAARLEGGEPLWPKPLAVAAIPYGHVQRTSDGLWRLGDQAAVIPSFIGEGMALALKSAEEAAETYLDGRGPEAFQPGFGKAVGLRVKAATALSHALVAPWSQAVAMTAPRSLVAAVAAAARV